jgi:pimeloyl-ACP methyl ester carboxylesterase
VKWHAPIPLPGRAGQHGQAAAGRRRRRAALGAAGAAVLAVAVLAAVLAVSGAPPGRPPARPAASSRTAALRPGPPERLPVGTPGRYAVAQTVLALVDRSRAGLGPRALPTVVRYPVIPPAGGGSRALARGLFPLVVFAPGYLQCESGYAALLGSWASAGYVVAAVDFPRTSCHAGDPDEDDLSNQPADLAYVIRQVLAVSGAPRGALAGLVNPAEIAVAGHSDGGDTAVAVAAGSCCADPGVRAAIILAGAEWPPLGGTYFARASPPVLFVQGDADTVNLPADSIAMYQADRAGPRFYLDLPGAGHFPPYEGGGPPEPVVARVTLAFLNRYLDGQASASAAMARAGNITGIATLVSGGRLPP